MDNSLDSLDVSAGSRALAPRRARPCARCLQTKVPSAGVAPGSGAGAEAGGAEPGAAPPPASQPA